MARRRIDVSRFIESAPEMLMEVQETPAQRRARISMAMESVDAMKGAIIENRRENERMVRNHRKAKNDLFLDMRDLMAGIGHVPSGNDALLPEDRMGMSMPAHHEFLTEQFPTNHDDMIMEQMHNPQPRQPLSVQNGRNRGMFAPVPSADKRSVLREQAPLRKAPKLDLTTKENWIIKKYLGETRGGDTVPVWKVQNKNTGSALDRLFRIEGVANRIAMILNETGDMNDSRIASLISAYDKRDKLLKEARLLEKTAEGKPMKTERLHAIRAEINQLDYRLGI